MSSKVPRRQALSCRAGFSCLHQVSITLFNAAVVAIMLVPVPVSAFYFFGALDVSIANDVVTQFQELTNNSSLGLGSEGQPPPRTIVVGGTIPAGVGGLQAGPIYSRMAMNLGGTISTIEMYGMALQNPLGQYALLCAAASRVTARSGSSVGGGANVSVSAGANIPGIPGLILVITQETFIFSGGISLTTYRIGLRATSFGRPSGTGNAPRRRAG